MDDQHKTEHMFGAFRPLAQIERDIVAIKNIIKATDPSDTRHTLAVSLLFCYEREWHQVMYNS